MYRFRRCGGGPPAAENARPLPEAMPSMIANLLLLTFQVFALEEHEDPGTFSICALDPETGELGVAVTTRVPFVGRAVPFVRAGVGAVATQAFTVVRYGRDGLDLLEGGAAPDEAIAKLLENDEQRERRQIGILDAQGRAAAHTGARNGAYAGDRRGRNCVVQGNLLVGPGTLDAVVGAFEASDGKGRELPDRLLEALAAGQAAGGDKRKGLPQSAALVLAHPRETGRDGSHVTLEIRVDEHPTPVAEMRRIYDRTRSRLGWRPLSEQSGRDVVELKRMLHALGHFRKDAESLPSFREDPAFSVYDAEAISAVEAFRKEEGLPVAADDLGFPRGLVDEACVAALRERFEGLPKDKREAAFPAARR